MKYLVTGAAGFIGSNLVDALLGMGHAVTGVDDFRTGSPENLAAARTHSRFQLVERDVAKTGSLADVVQPDHDCIFHLSANADVRHGMSHPFKDLEQNALATVQVLEAARKAGAKKVLFASTASVYGDTPQIPSREDCPFPVQTSLYAASKLAAEGALGAYGQASGIMGIICRLVSVLGKRYSHGHIVDFFQQLRSDPSALKILGDGHQRKSYLHVEDCVSAMVLLAGASGLPRTSVFNLGTEESITVRDSLKTICEELGVSPRLSFGSEPSGWPGDNPRIEVNCEKLRKLGWKPKHGILDSVRQTVRDLQAREKGLS